MNRLDLFNIKLLEELKMAENYIDYEVLEQCKTFYGETATQKIAELIKAINDVNTNQLLVGWRNETSKAFVQHYEEHHKKALMDLSDALVQLSSSIATYSQNRQDEDTEGAAAWR